MRWVAEEETERALLVLSPQLLAVTPTAHFLEYVDWAAPILERPLAIADGMAIPSDVPGVGLDWNEEAVSRFALE